MPTPAPSIKVLVIDDSDVDCALVAGLLGKNPTIRQFFAANGRQGLAAIESVDPDVVVSDLVMPEMDGLELMRTARIKFPLVPVIIMTSRGNEEIAVETLQAGAASYIPKRRLPGQLLPTLQKVIEASVPQRAFAHLLGCLTRSEYNFVLNNDSRLFWPLVVYMQESLAHLGMDNATERTRVGMAMAEALANALYHGNLEMSSAIQEQDDAAYDTLLEQRLHQPPYCDRHIHVSVKLCRSEAVFTIRDEGPGFDPSSLPDPTDPANLERVSGRGLLLIRAFMDGVSYNSQGNEVTLVKRLDTNLARKNAANGQ
jgi:CheY-like chemotaxis protein/anti-sigma regulatory factor (Ser/Thr protein kinase)